MLTAKHFAHTPLDEHSLSENKRQWKLIFAELQANRSIHSESGWSAAIAINICELQGWGYQVKRHPQSRYYVERWNGEST